MDKMSIQKHHIFVFILLLILTPDLQSQPEKLWHGIERTVRYQPDGSDFVIHQGTRRFNRALYGSSTGFRIEAGDLPEFALYLPGMGGNLKLGLGNKEHSIWLIDAESISATYRPGSMIYQISDSILGEGEIKLNLLALDEGEGLILRVKASEIPKDTRLYWAFGGANGKKFPRSGDIGADPESSFYLNPEYCIGNEFIIKDNSFNLYFGKDMRINGVLPPKAVIKIGDANAQISPHSLFRSEASAEPVVSGHMPLPEKEDLYFILIIPSGQASATKDSLLDYQNASALFEGAEEARKKLAGRIRISTPDPYINTLGAALSIAADAIWETPSYLHGAVAWRNRLAGWRGAYAADWLGWHDRARMHFSSYSKSQYTSPASAAAAPDPATNLSRQIEKAGYSLFSEGYISRRPNKISPPHHYDMNLVYIDQLLWHINWTGDLDFAREMWPTIKRHLAWEKRCFDPDGDGLYNAYCCIWASDALQYSGGGVTHSSAYNYRGFLLAGRLAGLLGEDPEPYLAEAHKIRKAVNENLWLSDMGWYAEYKDQLGLKLVHPRPALWTIYHAIDSRLANPFQAYQSLRYIEEEIPHIPLLAKGLPQGEYYTLSTSDWMPYTWSINNVALAENLNTSLAFWQAGRREEAFILWKSQLLESMYTGASPGNFQQLSFYDAFRGELYRDFADPVGLAARTLVEGLFGIVPDALGQKLSIRPGFPMDWDSASLKTPDIYFHFQRQYLEDRYTIIPGFSMKMDLSLILDARGSEVKICKINGAKADWKVVEDAIGNPVIEVFCAYSDSFNIEIQWAERMPELASNLGKIALGEQVESAFADARVLDFHDPQNVTINPVVQGSGFEFTAGGLPGHRCVFIRLQLGEMSWWQTLEFELVKPVDFLALTSAKGDGLHFNMVNNSRTLKEGFIRVNSVPFATEIQLAAGVSKDIHVPPGFLYPGTNRIEFLEKDVSLASDLIDWNIPARDKIIWEQIDLTGYFNDRVDQIFKNNYVSPRANTPTLQIPIQGIGDWCSYKRLPTIDDSGLRTRAGKDGMIVLDQGIPLATPGKAGEHNIIYTAQWDNYPEEIMIPLTGNAIHAYFLMTGSVHHMQHGLCNGKIHMKYTDGSSDILELEPPANWWPIEQDFYMDGFAFSVNAPKPPRVFLKTGEQQKEDYQVLRKNGTNDIDGGAATLYDLPLDPTKELKELRLETLANDVVLGLMSISLIRPDPLL